MFTEQGGKNAWKRNHHTFKHESQRLDLESIFSHNLEILMGSNHSGKGHSEGFSR